MIQDLCFIESAVLSTFLKLFLQRNHLQDSHLSRFAHAHFLEILTSLEQTQIARILSFMPRKNSDTVVSKNSFTATVFRLFVSFSPARYLKSIILPSVAVKVLFCFSMLLAIIVHFPVVLQELHLLIFVVSAPEGYMINEMFGFVEELIIRDDPVIEGTQNI